ncbi:MAG: hypothetical protein WC824_08100 [Bacteroidota bacterium]
MTPFSKEYREKLLTLQFDRAYDGGLPDEEEAKRAEELDHLWSHMTQIEQEVTEAWIKGKNYPCKNPLGRDRLL